MDTLEEQFIGYALRNNLNGIVAALAQGVDIHYNDDAALRINVDRNNASVVAALLKHGANVHVNDNSVLKCSADRGYLEILVMLLEHGADVHAGNDAALQYGVEHNHLDIVVALLKYGANVWAKNDAALLCSVNRGYVRMTAVLLENGADVCMIDYETIIFYCDEGDTIMECIYSSDEKDIVVKGTVVKEKMSDIILNHVHQIASQIQHCEATSKFLVLAAANGNLSVVIELLNLGADIHFNDDAVLQWSIHNNHFVTASKLLEYGADIYCNNNKILKNLRTNFNEALASLLLPYCDSDSYKYFPVDYVCKNIVPTKNSVMI